jgi:hypothetical protein
VPPQLPPDNSQFQFFDTAAALVAAGVPAPTYLWPCQEAAGAGVIADAQGVANLVAAGDVAQGQRTPGIWNPVAKNFAGLYRKAAACSNALATHGFVCADPAIGELGMNSLAFVACFRIASYNTSLRGLLQKCTGTLSTSNGWSIQVDDSQVKLQIRDGVTYKYMLSAAEQVFQGNVIVAHGYANRTTGFGRVWTSSGGWGTANDISALVNPITAPAIPLQMFSGGGAGYLAADGQILWAALWVGGDAETLGNGWTATYRPIFYPLWTVTDCPPNNSEVGRALYGYSSAKSYALVARDLTSGLSIGSFRRYISSAVPGSFAWAWSDQINRLVMRAENGSRTSLVAYTDAFDVASWTKVNVAVAAAWSDRIEAPDGFLTARRLTATANAGYANYTATVTAGANYVMSFLHRRRAGGADVAGRLVAYDNTVGAELASVPFVAGALWEISYLEITVPVGTVSVAMRIEITTNGDIIYPYRANFYTGSYQRLVLYRHNNTYAGGACRPFRQYVDPSEAIDNSRGEIEIKYCRDSNVNLLQQRILIRSGGGWYDASIGTADERLIYFDAVTNHLMAQVRDNVGVGAVVALIDGGLIDFTVEHRIQLRWDVGGLPSGNTIELIVDGGIPISGSVVPWAWSNYASRYYCWQCRTVDGSTYYQPEGYVRYIKIWADPQ